MNDKPTVKSTPVCSFCGQEGRRSKMSVDGERPCLRCAKEIKRQMEEIPMTKIEELKASEWFKSRPPAVKKAVEKHPPHLIYRMKSTGHRVRLYSYSEKDGKCTECQVLVLKDLNPGIIFERRVFGIELDDLMPEYES